MKVYVVTTNVVTGFNYTLDDLVEETTEAETGTAETAKMEKLNSEQRRQRKLWRLWKRKLLQRRKQIRMLPTNDNDVI